MCEVTIAIASYNVGQYINQCLISVLNQDFEDTEILVCDDCSTDNSLQIVESIIKSHPKGNKIRIIQLPHNQGTAAIRNLGIDNAKGKYLLFLDGDDYIPENAVSVLHKKMIETNADFVMGSHVIFTEDIESSSADNIKKIYSPYYKTELINRPFALAEWMRRLNTDYYPVALWNKLFKISFLKQKNIRCIPSHNIIDDIYFAFQTFIKTDSFAVVSNLTMFWRKREDSATHMDVKKERVTIYIDIFDTILDNILSIRKETHIPVQIYYLITRRYVSGFITKNILFSKSLSIKEKKRYLDHISVITRIGLKRSEMIGRFNKCCFFALSSKYRFYMMKVLYWLRKKKLI